MKTEAIEEAVIYGRNSSKLQKSIDEQTDEGRAAAAENRWRVVAELSDPLSASRYARKIRENWTRLLELLPSVDVVILWEPSRGDRSLATWVGFLEACRTHRVRIHAITHGRTYDPLVARDYRSLAEDGVDSAYESDKTSARVRRGLAGVMAAGRPHGALAYGYRRIYDERGNLVEQVEDAAGARIVRDIFRSVAEGKPLHALCVGLTRDGVPTPRGGRVWYSSTLSGIIRNPVYRPHAADPSRGCLTHEGVILDNPAAWAPLVDEVTWLAANRVLGTNDQAARRGRRDSAPGAVKYLLSGNAAVMSAPCGSLLTGWTMSAGRGAFYACRHDKCVSSPMHECDEYVSQLVVGRLSRADARQLWVQDDTATRAAADEHARLVAELEEARASFYAPGGISAVALAGKEAAMAPAIADAERRAQPVGAPLAALKLIDAATLSETTVRPMWDQFAVPAKREIVAGLFASLVLGPMTNRIMRWTSPEDRLAIVADRISHEWRTSS